MAGAKNDGAGGGGAGAVYHATGVTLPSSPISVQIGERGTGANSAANGGGTTFGPVTAQGGGYGNDGGDGNPGGSGGGGGGPGTPSGGSSYCKSSFCFWCYIYRIWKCWR